MSLTDDIRRTFEKASLQHEATKGLGGDDWARYREIQAGHEQKQRGEQQAYYSEYDTRVEAARKQLIDKAAQKERPLLPRLLRRDGFNRADIDRQAHRMVQDAHHRALAGIEAERSDRIEALLAQAQKRKDLANQVRTSFEQASDRRAGQERRTGPKRLH